MAIEGSCLRVPFEEARRYSRANQRIVEKDLPALVGAFHEKIGSDSTLESRYQERLHQLLERVQSNHGKEREYIRKLELRYQYLERLVKNNDPAQYHEWLDMRLRRLVVEYYLDAGELEFASSLVSELSVSDWIDVEVYADREQIMVELREKKSFAQALSWCSDNRQSLKKSKSLLEFCLRRQEMIEMSRSERIADALGYGRRHLYSWLAEEDVGSELWKLAESAMALVVSRNEKADEAHAETIDLFKREFNQLYGIYEPPLLAGIVRAGLTLLKTPNCGDPDYYNINCPACQPELAKIAADLPYAHHDNSILVCRITGERMDADNPPMVLPNGNVYSLNGLKKFAGEGSAKAKCPRTGAEFAWDELRKIFVT